MALGKDYNLGPAIFPRGWFMIAPSEEATNTPLPLRYFSRDMVLYRGESGKPYLVDAYCPHMGAHIGDNTTSFVVQDKAQVDGESIRCPFHNWRFGPDGQCTHIPYFKGPIPAAARIETFPVVERAGVIWMWHDEEGGAPTYDLPAFAEWDDPEWVRWTMDIVGELNIHPIEVVDNMADVGHMVPVHGSVNCVYFDNDFDGITVSQKLTAGHRVLAEGDSSITYSTWYTGPALLQSRLDGDLPAHMLIAHTPVEDGKVKMWHALMVKCANTAAEDKGVGMARAYQAASLSTLAQDVQIWSRKKPIFNPLVVPADGPVGRVRRWYKQFYEPAAAAPDTWARINGKIVTLDVPEGEQGFGVMPAKAS